MKDRKAKCIVFAISIVAILILSSFNSLGSSTKLNVVNDKSTSNSSVVSLQATISTSTIKLSEFYGLNDMPFNNSKNIVITNKTRNESYPSIVTGSYRALASFEVEDEGGKSRIYFRNSGNYGQSWSSNEGKLVAKLNDANPDIEVKHPSLCVSPKSPYNAYGAFVSTFNNSGINGYLITPNVGADLGNTEIHIIDWSVNDFYNFENPDIVAFDNSATPWVFVQIGSTDYVDPASGLGPCKKTPMFVFESLDGSNYITTAWFPDIQNCSNVSIANHFGDDTIYGVCEIQNESRKDLLFFKGNPESWVSEEDELENLSLWFPTVNFSHPQIFVKGDQIYIVAETDAHGKKEIVLFNSYDLGDTWTEQIVTENRPPIPDFSYTAERLNVTFTDMSTDADGYITTWDWDFGDGNTSDEQNPPQHIYESPGSYTVNLTVKDDENVESNVSKIITLSNTTPIANFTYGPPQPLAGKNVTFNSTSTVYGDNIIENYTWDFGDGSDMVYEEYVNVTHIYAENGTYIAKLAIRDSALTNDSIEKVIRVGLAADFTFVPNNPLVGETVDFTDASSIPVGQTITNWTWDFGDGETSTDQDPSHQYSSPGVYTVNLTTKDNNDTTNTILKQVIVRHISLIPRFPQVYANETHVSIVLNSNSNIYVINSMDQGGNWSNYLQLNDQSYSVVEEYRFADIADMNHIVWTDNRDGNKDIYSVLRALLEIDLMIVPGSINLSTEGYNFIQAKNWIEFTVRNNGSRFVENVPIEITYERSGKDPEKTEYQTFLTYLNVGAEKTIGRPLFRLTVIEFINALIDFAGIQNIIVTVDPNDSLGDTDFSNNAYTLTNVTYGLIFPRLAWLEDIL